jgi:hypothetical protein
MKSTDPCKNVAIEEGAKNPSTIFFRPSLVLSYTEKNRVV